MNEEEQERVAREMEDDKANGRAIAGCALWVIVVLWLFVGPRALEVFDFLRALWAALWL